MRPVLRVVGVTAALTTLGLAACGSHPAVPVPGAASQPLVEISISHCGQGWRPDAAGHQQLVLHNTDTRPGEALLTDARTGAVFSYLEPLAAGSSANLSVDLGAGSYRFRCAMEDEDVVDGPTVAVTGPFTGATTPAVLPVTQAELIGPTKQYEAYVAGRLPILGTMVGRLVADLAAGNLGRARTDWLPAHLEYERLGAAYGAFGDADTAIDGLPDGLAGGIGDARFTGFHRLEYGLWHALPAAGLLPFARDLQAKVDSLARDFATAQLDPSEVAVRAHEITENAIQFELTGHTDFGSHSNLATVAANLAGTATVLAMLKPILATRDHDLARLQSSLDHARQLITAGTSLGRLSTAQRERVNSAMGDLVELLAPVAEICEPRRNS